MPGSTTPIACKFGGSSLADAAQIRKMAAILREEPRRRCVVVSAPGKRSREDEKVTDLLYRCHRAGDLGAFAAVRSRYEETARDLGVDGVDGWLREAEEGLRDGRSQDWVASRGEYLHARLIAAYLGARFVDATDCVRFDSQGHLDGSTYALTATALAGDGLVVIPGFYGQDPDGEVKTFSRGGSDITGAIVARAAEASVYENWTDVDGLLMADPRVVANPRPIREVTYRELRELAYMGASVLHDEAVFPVREVEIPIHFRNTNNPTSPGTRVTATRPLSDLAIVGVAGRRGFTTIALEKSMMNQERGFGRRVLEVVERHGISFEHAPSGIDSMSVVIQDEELGDQEAGVLEQIRQLLEPDRLEVLRPLSLIATVGEGMSHRVGVAGRLFGALAQAGVNVRMINQGVSENNIIVGVATPDYEAAVRAIYHAFVPA